MSDLQAYFEHLRAHLRLGPTVEEEVVRELQTHVEDRLAEMEREGIRRPEAERRLLRALDRPQVLARQFQAAYMPATWSDVLTAACAFLMVAALFATHLWNRPAVALAVAAIVVGTALYGLWQGRPAWHYPWAGLALTLLSFCGYFAFVLLDRSARLAAHSGFDNLSLLGFAGAALYFPIALVIFGSCILVTSRRDWLDASLMLSPTAPVVGWIIVLHESGGIRAPGAAVAVADTALAATFLAMAAAAAVFVKVRTRSLKLTTLIATGALILVMHSSIYEPQFSLAVLAGRALLLFAFLLSPALLEAFVIRPLRSTG